MTRPQPRPPGLEDRPGRRPRCHARAVRLRSWAHAPDAGARDATHLRPGPGAPRPPAGQCGCAAQRRADPVQRRTGVGKR